MMPVLQNWGLCQRSKITDRLLQSLKGTLTLRSKFSTCNTLNRGHFASLILPIIIHLCGARFKSFHYCLILPLKRFSMCQTVASMVLQTLLFAVP